MSNEPLREYNVHRSLSDPVYLFRMYFIRLEEVDLALVAFLSLLAWILIDMFGHSKTKVWGLTLDPFGGFLVAIILTLAISAFHKFRPEGGIGHILRGVREPRLLAPRTFLGDRAWRPSFRLALIPDDYRLPMWKRREKS